MGRIGQVAVRVSVILGFAVASTIVGGSAANAAQGPYTALGDSYSSGVGTREYDPDSGDCKRSPHAYPVLGAEQLGAELSFAACSGAEVPDIYNQLDSLNEGTAYVSVSVGGNDAGFVDVITQCALPWPTTCWNEIDAANAFIESELPGLLDDLYSEIGAAAPNAAVAVVGYPRLFNGEECNLAARISSGEQEELNATADLLAETISGRAAAHGFTFVDVRDAYVSHAVCDDDEWINGLSDPIGESYHPNRAGQSDGYTPLVTAALQS